MDVVNPGASSRFLLLGDHAGRAIPRRLGDLGLAPQDRERHIAWDIGVAALGEQLSERLGAAFVRQRYSRLVIDCNRDPVRPDAIPEASDGTAVPGNHGLTPQARAARVRAVFAPYHDRIAAELDARRSAGGATLLVALHSFTPQMAGQARPWRFGVLHRDDSPFSRAVLARLRADPARLEVGDNQPYRMDETDFTIPHHAGSRGLDYVEVEVRQDLLKDLDGVAAAAERLARVLVEAAEDLGRETPG